MDPNSITGGVTAQDWTVKLTLMILDNDASVQERSPSTAADSISLIPAPQDGSTTVDTFTMPMEAFEHEPITEDVTTITVMTTEEVGDPVQGTPSQTFTPPLTTIFTPPTECRSRYYVGRPSDSRAIRKSIYSGISDREYRSCQPDPEAYENYYSPGACPYLMNIAAVSSSTSISTLNGTSTAVTYTDICCQKYVAQFLCALTCD
jgi:hypothetical protein